jgi:hypothetical protein
MPPVNARLAGKIHESFRKGWQDELTSTTESRVKHDYVALLPVLKKWDLISGYSVDGVRTARIVFESGQKALGVLISPYIAKSLKSRVEARENAATAAAAGSSSTTGTTSSRKRKLEDALMRTAAKRAAMAQGDGTVLIVQQNGSVEVKSE